MKRLRIQFALFFLLLAATAGALVFNSYRQMDRSFVDTDLAARLCLDILPGAVILLLTLGLFFIYRSTTAQIALSERRQDFVSAITDEIKAPLTSIRMYSEMLEGGLAKNEEKKRDYYRQISRESGRLSRLIENVLQLARLEKKTYKVNLKVADPDRDFMEIGDELKKIAEISGFSLWLKADPNLPQISYDPEAIKRIFLSLLDNSIKFCSKSPDKSLEMSLRREGNQIVFSFGDRGPGIPTTELEKVFHNFYRVENKTTRKTKGLASATSRSERCPAGSGNGIGLAISRMLAQTIGAKIYARGRIGGGVEIRLAIPIKIA